MVSHKKRFRTTKTEALQKIIKAYKSSHPDKPFDMKSVYHWAVENEMMSPPQVDAAQIGAKMLSRAAAEEYYKDPQGREVRKKHVARYKQSNGGQLFLWDDIEDAKPQHMHLALSQRRAAALGETRQLKTDKDSYNENNKHGAYIPMSFNFDEDLAEMELPTEYPSAPPDDDGKEIGLSQ